MAAPPPARSYTSALYSEDEPPDAHPALHHHDHDHPSPRLTAEAPTAAAAAARLPALLSAKAWRLTPDGKGVAKEYRFKGFRRGAWRFMAAVADAAMAANHHPTWTNTFNTVGVVWTTHRPDGLSWRDVELAEKCDEIAEGIEAEQGLLGGKKGDSAASA